MNATQKLPKAALLALFFSGFVSLMTEALPSGLLPELARGLHVNLSLAGQTVALYALATALGAIPIARLTTTWSRKRVLQTALVIIAAANLLTAASSLYWLTMLIRFVAGLGTAMTWPLLGGYGAAIAPKGKEGQALNFALAGQPVGLALGIPIGVALTSVISWRMIFVLTAILALLNLLWNVKFLPSVPGRAVVENRPSILKTLRTPGFPAILTALAAFMVAHNIVYTYVTDFLASIHLTAQTSLILFTFGATSIVSIFFIGALIDQHLRALTIMAAAGFAISMLVLAVLSQVLLLVYLAAAAWGLFFGSAGSLFINAAIRATGEAADIGQAIVVTAFSGSISLGAFTGGLLISLAGTASIPWAALSLLILSTLIVMFARQHAFPRDI